MPAPRPTPPAGRKPKRRLAPSEKYEIYVAVLTGQATQREAAERFGVDRAGGQSQRDFPGAGAA